MQSFESTIVASELIEVKFYQDSVYVATPSDKVSLLSNYTHKLYSFRRFQLQSMSLDQPLLKICLNCMCWTLR